MIKQRDIETNTHGKFFIVQIFIIDVIFTSGDARHTVETYRVNTARVVVGEGD